MKLDSNIKFIYFRLVVIFVASIFFVFLTFKILKQTINFELEWLEIFLVSTCLCTIFLFGVVNTIIVESNTLKFRNIFGITLKQISLEKIKNIKIIYTHAKFQDQYLFTILRKDDREVKILLHLKNFDKYSFNGLILSKKGVKYFTKNQR